MSQLNALRLCSTLQDFATLLGFRPQSLAYILYKIPDVSKYHSFRVAKRKGGFREINAPCPELKLLQRHLSDLLQNCAAEINSTKKFPDQLSHGFKRKRSIINNAVRHRNRRYVFNVDLENFFPSINFGRVRGFFIKNVHFMLNNEVATVLAQIACYQNSLPQGSPCSPVISNLIAHILDIRLCSLATKQGCVYSRYADDITFSTNKLNFPDSIAKQIAGTHKWEVGRSLNDIIIKAGFSINQCKTRMQYHDSRQDVTGLVVNAKVNIRSNYRHNARAMAQNLFMTGHFDLMTTVADANGVLTPTKVIGNMNQLQGILGHIDFVDSYNADVQSKHGDSQAAKRALRSKQALYRRFLIFKDFYSAQRSVVVCEGKTDNVYLHHAIKSLASKYPQLATISPTNEVALNIRLLKIYDSSIGRLLHLGHGSSDLARLIEQYLSEMDRFKAAGMSSPVILLVDNDGGSDCVYSAIKKHAKKKASRTDIFSYVAGNLYVISVPLKQGSTQCEIEDCFDDAIKNLNLGGKTFNADDKADRNLYFGKAILAQHVRENASKVNFKGFEPLLDRIVTVMNDYKAKVAPGPIPAGAVTVP